MKNVSEATIAAIVYDINELINKELRAHGVNLAELSVAEIIELHNSLLDAAKA